MLDKNADNRLDENSEHDFGTLLISELLSSVFEDVASLVGANKFFSLSALADNELFIALSASSRILYQYELALVNFYTSNNAFSQFKKELNKELNELIDQNVVDRTNAPSIDFQSNLDGSQYVFNLQTKALEKIHANNHIEDDDNSNLQDQLKNLISTYDHLPFH